MGGARAQLIPIKTAPIATGSQFQLYPSHARGMGGLSIAVNDSLGDAFVNPAKATRLDGTWAFSAPSYYTITGPDGDARTLSVGGLVDQGAWFGGLAVALQQLDMGTHPPRPIIAEPRIDPAFSIVPEPRRPLRETSAENQYVTVLGGLQLSDRFALAGRVRWAGLNAMEGVDLLYPGNIGLQQDGHRLGVRVGLLGEWNEQSLSVLLLHDRIDMQHAVRYLDVLPQESSDRFIRTVRLERYFDRTNTWGLHAEYVRPLGGGGWRLGTVLTANRKNHPKIPNYELMNIPRDPGTSWAFNTGVGVAHTARPTTFGVEVVSEPILSNTWATAQEPITIPECALPEDCGIEPGEKTVDNDFTFLNTTLRTGLQHGHDWWDVQLGVEVRTIRYWLTQKDRVQRLERDQYEEWSEWRLTWGGGIEWSSVHLRYTGHLTVGTGRPGVARRPFLREASFAAGDFVVAPRGALALEQSRVFTHQISVTIPLSGDEE